MEYFDCAHRFLQRRLKLLDALSLASDYFVIFSSVVSRTRSLFFCLFQCGSGTVAVV